MSGQRDGPGPRFPGPFTFLPHRPLGRPPSNSTTSREEASTGQDQPAENATGLESWSRTHVMHHATLVAAAALATATPAHHPTKLERAGEHLRTRVIHLYGHRAPGCDLIAGKCRRHPDPSWQQKHRYVQVL